MKKFLALAAAASVLAIAAPASAQAWQSINQRQANLDQRIDMGVRNGSLTRNEAVRLRAEFNDLNRLEARYRATGGGLSLQERADLDRRFDSLSTRIRYERNDAQNSWGRDWNNGGRWMNINERQRYLDQRIDQGRRNGSLSLTEATRLRMEFQNIARLEARYRSTGGLNRNERQDLDLRFDRLGSRITAESRDRNNYFG